MKKFVFLYYLLLASAMFYACTNDISENILPSPNLENQQENATGVVVIISDDDGNHCDDCCMFDAENWCSVCRECQCCRNCACDVCAGNEATTQEQTVFRDFKDNLLSQNAMGKRFNRLYYQNSARIFDVVMSNQNIRNDFLLLLTDLYPYCNNLVNGNGNMIISPSTTQMIDNMLDEMLSVNNTLADPYNEKTKLKQSIHYLKSKIPLSSYNNLSMNFAWNQVSNITP